MSEAELQLYRKLQTVATRLHAARGLDALMAGVPADLCHLFECERCLLYAMDQEKDYLVSREGRVAVIPASIAGYVAPTQQTLNIADVHDAGQLRAISPELQFLPGVDQRTGYRTRQVPAAPIADAQGKELLGVLQLVNTRGGGAFTALQLECLQVLCETLAVALAARQAPRCAARAGAVRHPAAAAAADAADSAAFLAEKIITEACRLDASDIHIEPHAARGIRVLRLRRDGALLPYAEAVLDMHAALVARLKSMCGLPSGGRQAAVPRIQPARRGAARHIHPLGRRHGGRGAAPAQQRRPDAKAGTIEEPVEIVQPGARQVPVQRETGMDFNTALGAVLRADSDLVAIGDLRDKDTAAKAIEAALGGRMVLGGLHTGSAADTLGRLQEMGSERFALADALLGVLALRLAKRLCEHCKLADQPGEAELELLLAEYVEELRDSEAFRAERRAAPSPCAGRSAARRAARATRAASACTNAGAGRAPAPVAARARRRAATARRGAGRRHANTEDGRHRHNPGRPDRR